MTGHVKSPKMTAEHALRLARFRLMAERHMQNLGAAVWRTREELGLSRSELGANGIAAEKTVERWEKGTTGGLMEALPAVAKRLRTTPDDLMALAVQIGKERGDAPPSIRPEDRIGRLEETMDRVLNLLERQAVQEAEDVLGKGEDQERPPGEAEDT